MRVIKRINKISAVLLFLGTYVTMPVASAEINDCGRLGEYIMCNQASLNITTLWGKAQIAQKSTIRGREILANRKWKAGLEAMIKEDYIEAAIQFSQAAELNPQDACVYEYLGDAYFGLNDKEKALENYNKAIGLDPTNAFVYEKRGKTYEALEDYEKAIEEYTKAIELEQRVGDFYIERGMVYSCVGNYKSALSDFTDAVERSPSSTIAYGLRGLTYLSLRDYENAIFDCTRAIEIDPGNAGAYSTRGLAYKMIGDALRANDDFIMAKSLGYGEND